MAILCKNPFRAQKLMSWRFWLSHKTVRKFAQLPTYYQRQKCSPGILVCRKVRVMCIFARVHWRGGVKWEWGCRKWRFLLLLLAISSEPLHRRPQVGLLCERLNKEGRISTWRRLPSFSRSMKASWWHYVTGASLRHRTDSAPLHPNLTI